jgi:hypothetical protein
MSVWWYLAIAALIVLIINVFVVLLFVITGERSARADDAFFDSWRRPSAETRLRPNVFRRPSLGRTQWVFEAAIIVVSLAVAYFAATL